MYNACSYTVRSLSSLLSLHFNRPRPLSLSVNCDHFLANLIATSPLSGATLLPLDCHCDLCKTQL